MLEQEIAITGMSCQHCVMSVKKELGKIPGLEIKAVTVGAATVAVDESKVTREQIKAAVEEAGFALIG
jgi:copper chaperone